MLFVKIMFLFLFVYDDRLFQVPFAKIALVFLFKKHLKND
jgi:hypothetical protein